MALVNEQTQVELRFTRLGSLLAVRFDYRITLRN